MLRSALTKLGFFTKPPCSNTVAPSSLPSMQHAAPTAQELQPNAYPLCYALLRQLELVSKAVPWSGDPDKLEAALRVSLKRGQEPWPKYPTVSTEPFLAYVARQIDCDTSLEEQLEQSCVDDLWLTHACLCGEPLALQTFDRLLRMVCRNLRIDRELSPDDCDEFLQQARETLLVVEPDDSPPKLEAYNGKGSLNGWLRVVLRRRKMRYQNTVRQEASLSSTLEDVLLLEKKDPEFASLRKEHQALFRDAFRASVSRLRPKDQLILRYWLLHDMNLMQLGRALELNRVTIARRLVRIRRVMLMLLRLELRKKMFLRAEDIESLLHGIDTRFDASMAKLFSASRTGS